MGVPNGPKSVPGRSGGVSGGGVVLEACLDETIRAGPEVPSLGPPVFGKGSLGASWANFDLSGIPLGSLWGYIGGHLGSCLTNLGPSWDHFWAIWGAFGLALFRTL